MNEFKLTAAERDTPLWKKLSAHFERRLNELRAKNDNPKLSDNETAALRGRIIEVKETLVLGKDTQSVSISDTM